MFILYLFLTHMVFYWATALYFVIVHGQRSKYSSVLVKNVLRNQIMYTPIYLIPFYFYPTPHSSWNAFWQLPGIVLLTDMIFYSTHRYFHHNKYLFTRVHKYHHTMDDPQYAPGALNAHPVEHIFVNLLSTVAPLFIVKANLYVSLVWTAAASVNVVVAHSATCENDAHELHHKYKAYNYGAGPLIFDRMFGSYKIENLKH